MNIISQIFRWLPPTQAETHVGSRRRCGGICIKSSLSLSNMMTKRASMWERWFVVIFKKKTQVFGISIAVALGEMWDYWHFLHKARWNFDWVMNYYFTTTDCGGSEQWARSIDVRRELNCPQQVDLLAYKLFFLLTRVMGDCDQRYIYSPKYNWHGK